MYHNQVPANVQGTSICIPTLPHALSIAAITAILSAMNPATPNATAAYANPGGPKRAQMPPMVTAIPPGMASSNSSCFVSHSLRKNCYIEATQCRLSDYQQLFQSARFRLLDERDAHADHPLSVARTFALAFEQLKKNNSAAAELLTVCAFLGAKGPTETPAFVSIERRNVASSASASALTFFR